MARYSQLLGRRVEVHYRAGDILLPASGTLVADSGRSIFLEQNLLQRGQERHFRWEIPYQYIVRIDEKADEPAVAEATPRNTAQSPAAQQSAAERTADRAAAKQASSRGGAPGLLPVANRPKTA